MRVWPLYGLILVVAGCCCRPSADAPPLPVESSQQSRHFVVVRGTVLAAAGEEPAQILLESSWIAVDPGAPVPALDDAARLAEHGVPTWISGSSVPDASFGSTAKVLAAPSVVALAGDEARIELSDEKGIPRLRSLSLEPRLSDGQLHITVAYRCFRNRRLDHEISATTVASEPGRAFIFEAAAR